MDKTAAKGDSDNAGWSQKDVGKEKIVILIKLLLLLHCTNAVYFLRAEDGRVVVGGLQSGQRIRVVSKVDEPVPS